MPLPDANNYSMRIYELLKETDLENLSYAQFQGVAEKLFIEPENEDEMRRLVLVQLARMAVRGDWDGFLNGGGGSGAPADAEYLIAFDGSIPASLTAARKLVVGNNISMAHGAGANDDVTLSATPGGSDGQIQYNVAGVLAATGLLSTNKTNELTIVAISGDGQINISSPTKAVSLLCDENQKLKVKGATDSFVLDVSSSSGGITFPDGTTQSTASTGGGTKYVASPLIQPPDIGSNKVYYSLSLASYSMNGNAQVTTWNTNSNTTIQFSPALVSKTGTIDEAAFRTGSTAGDTIYLALYRSDSNNMPTGSAAYTFNTGTTTNNTQYEPTINLSVTEGELLWIAHFGQANRTSIWSTYSGTTSAKILPGLPRYNSGGINYSVGETVWRLTGQTNGVFPTLSSSTIYTSSATNYVFQMAVHIQE